MPKDSARTFGVHIYLPRDGAHRLEVERELVREYENSDKTRIGGARLVHRPVAALSAQALPGGSVTLATYADFLALVARVGDALELEDLSAEKAEAKRLADQQAADAAALAAERARAAKRPATPKSFVASKP